jgi:hypothetical protein
MYSNAVYPKICFRERTKCSLRGGKVQTFSGGNEILHTAPHFAFCNLVNNHMSLLLLYYSLNSHWGFSVTDYIKYYAYFCYLLGLDYLPLQQL